LVAHIAVAWLALGVVLQARPCYAVSSLCTCGGTPTAVQIDVWIDPGHDSQHRGNYGLNLDPAPPNEQDVTWVIAGDLVPILENNFYCALLTREQYSTIYSPHQRAGIAGGLCMNDAGEHAVGQAMVSIHTNSAGRNSAGAVISGTFGTYTIYPSVKSCGAHANEFLNDQSFAADLQAAMYPQMAAAYTGCGLYDPCNNNLHTCPSGANCAPGTKDAIEDAMIPAVIVEVGYQTNPCQECAMRLQPGVIANAVAVGIFNTFITPTACASANRSTAAWRPPRRARVVPSTSPEQLVVSRQPAKPSSTGQVLGFSEGFESTVFPPTGWTVQTSGAPSPFAWERSNSPYYVATGSGAAFVGGGYASAKDEWLISPAISLGAGDSGVQFNWVGNRNFSDEVEVQLLARPSAGGSWTLLWSLSSEPYGNVFAVKSTVASLSTFAGQSIQIAFRATGTKGADFSIDDVAIGPFQVSLPPSNDQCANAAQLPSGSFNLMGATCKATNDMDPSGAGACIGYEMDGPDVFYRFSVGVGDTLSASVHALWGPGLYVMKSCSGASADCLAGSYYEDSDADPSVDIVFSQAGQYYLAVDGPASGCGDFTLSGRLHGPTAGVRPDRGLERGLGVSPNPMMSQTTVVGSFRRIGDGAATLTITDIQGRRVLHRELALRRGQVSWDWNRQGLDGNRVPAGVYVVELRYGEEVLRSRIVVRD
jgi:N-acetylmuramoyl-L-alanine amidase